MLLQHAGGWLDTRAIFGQMFLGIASSRCLCALEHLPVDCCYAATEHVVLKGRRVQCRHACTPAKASALSGQLQAVLVKPAA